MSLTASAAAAPPPGLLEGERGAIARAISRVERGSADYSAALAPHLGRAHVIGITGPPGAGKSTLIEALLGELVARGRRVAVAAVDPSSPISGGAVLGDRVRMAIHGAHDSVFIRSLAARGHLGGLARCAVQVVDLLDAAGFDTVLVETVGTGQSEVEIMHVADTRIVACPPGLGDGVQAIKAGILEIADLLVVTKGDLPGAHSTARDLRQMLHLRPAATGWQVQVLAVTAAEGVAALADAIEAHERAAGRGRRLAARGSAAAGATRLVVAPQHLDARGACRRDVVYALADAALAGALPQGSRVVEVHFAFERDARAGETVHARIAEPGPARTHCRVEVCTDDGAVLARVGAEFEPAPPASGAA